MNKYINVYLNGNLTQMLIIHIDVFLSNYSEPINPKKKSNIAFGLNVVLLYI